MSSAQRTEVVTIVPEMGELAGVPGWRDGSTSAQVRFLGRSFPGRSTGGGRGPELEEVWAGGKRAQARMRQVHGAIVLAGHPGECGEGDALSTSERGLALVVVTADCLPILVADRDRVVAIHAGWRGFVAGVVTAALAEFADPGRLTAWIGPAIGPCCYEVGDEVADRVVARSSEAVRRPGGRGRPHLNLPRAAAIELARCGVGEIRQLDLCTACHPAILESYRRDGSAAGRNRSGIWLRLGAADQEG
ncbi:MAG: polyphenol oxidase family protein [Thermoanaerobaculia bacterium]